MRVQEPAPACRQKQGALRSRWARDRAWMTRTIRLAWFALVLGALIAALWRSAERDFSVDRVVIFMLPLTLPAGLIVVSVWGGAILLILNATGYLVPQGGTWNVVWAVLLWAAMSAGGYFQWFR